MSQRTDTYYPKTLARFAAKTSTKISLKALTIKATLNLLTNTKACKGEGRDARGRKAIRKYLDECLSNELQTIIIQSAVDRWVGSTKILGLLDIFEPKKIIREKLDLLGSFRYAYGCYYCHNKLYWSNGTIERLNLSKKQCNKLYNYIGWSDAIKNSLLQSITLATERGALEGRGTLLPHLFAQCSSLTKVTLLNGATNHVLRILGLNCPSLKHLDVSHSQSVSDLGLKGLLLKSPNAKVSVNDYPPDTRNACASTLIKIITIGTEISVEGLQLGCSLLETGYYVSFLPETLILRPFGGIVEPLKLDSALRRIGTETVEISGSEIVGGVKIILQRFVERRRGSAGRDQLLDAFVRHENYAQLYLRTAGSQIVEGMIGINKEAITQLILCWDSFTWSVASLPDLTELGAALPNLEVLKARIQGSWDGQGPLFPKLKETHIWTVYDETALSFFKFAPSIKTFKIHCLNLVLSRVMLNDRSLEFTLSTNKSLTRCLQEICIRPAGALTASAARYLIANCPKLERLGDMESWSVTPEEIKEINDELEKAGSSCVITVLSFPPKEVHEDLL